jgi:hypothetical protein
VWAKRWFKVALRGRDLIPRLQLDRRDKEECDARRNPSTGSGLTGSIY